jgi:hypothetical protein
MSPAGRWHRFAHHGMRAYYLALAAGVGLTISACLPWILVEDQRLGGVPSVAALWTLALGGFAILLASASIVTRKNSRHPLLLVGLIALGVLFLGYLQLSHAATEQAWAETEARALVRGQTAGPAPVAHMGPGLMVGFPSSLLLVLFGLTIIFRRAGAPYATPVDDDVEEN